MSQIRPLLLIVSVPFLIAPSPAPPSSIPTPLTGPDALKDADRSFAAAAKAKGLDGWMEFMADDAVRLANLGG
jgi:hypothetical protein